MKNKYFLNALTGLALMFSTANAQNCSLWIDSYTDATCPNSCDGSIDAGAAVMPNSNPSFLWTPGNMTSASVYNLCPGVYTVTLTTNNCSSTVSVTIGSGGVSATTSSVNATCSTCPNGTATVNVTGGVAPFSYLWSPTSQTTATATGLLPGNYVVYVSDNSTCGTTTHTVTVGSNSSTGIAQFNTDNGFSISPMPFSQSATISINDAGFSFPYQLNVMDLEGKVIRTITAIDEANYSFAKEEMASGVYFFRALSSNGKIANGKMIVE